MTDINLESLNNAELIALAQKVNTLICKQVVTKYLKDSVEQEYFNKEILDDKTLIDILTDSYYNNIKNMIFHSPYEMENLYSAYAMEQTVNENADML